MAGVRIEAQELFLLLPLPLGIYFFTFYAPALYFHAPSSVFLDL